MTRPPAAVLMCHADDPIDREGLARWLAQSMTLSGLVLVRDGLPALLRKAWREVRRVGPARFLDVLAFRAYYRLRLARGDAAWIDAQVARLKRVYPADLSRTPVLVTGDPNGQDTRRFLERIGPDLLVARCKHLLKPEVFAIARAGTYVLHPGICPEYRNAHGCFWALVNRDLDRVGMTLLRVDEGVDTGPVLLHARYAFDETRESPMVIQYKVVLENLDAIAGALHAAVRGGARPVSVTGRRSRAWGQPWLSAFVRWKHAVRQAAAR